jgi:hypothetical protein
MTIRAKIKQADIERLVRGAKKAGAKRVRVEPDGTVDILLEDTKTGAKTTDDDDYIPKRNEKLLW